MEPALLIAVMGATGAGKSSLINAITGIQTDVAHGLESGTSKVKEYIFRPSNSQTCILLDTPGFDDSTGDLRKTDSGIMEMLTSFIKERYGKSRKISSLLYLHNIRDESDKGPSLRCLTGIKGLCGHDPMKKIIVVTTFWDEVPVQEGVENENRLRTRYNFKVFSQAGVKFVRWPNLAYDKALTGSSVDSLTSILLDLAAPNSASSAMPRKSGHVTTGIEAQQREEAPELKSNPKHVHGIGTDDIEPVAFHSKEKQSQTQQEGEAKTRPEQHAASDGAVLIPPLSYQSQDINSEAALIANLKIELKLLKAQHAEDVQGFQSEIRQLKNDYSALTPHQTCKNLSSTVSELSLSLTELRKTSEQALSDLTRECENLRAVAREWERSSSESDIRSQLAQARLAAELDEARLELSNAKSELLQISQRKRLEGSCSCSILKSASVKGLTEEKQSSASLELEQPGAPENEGTITSSNDDDSDDDDDGWGSEFLSDTPSQGDTVQQNVQIDAKEGEAIPKMLSDLADMIHTERGASSASMFQQWRWL